MESRCSPCNVSSRSPAFPPSTPFEAIVTDDASGDPEVELLRGVAGLRLEINPTNLGFLKTCNRSAELARGDYLFFLNNDTLVCEGWLEPLLRGFRPISRRRPRRFETAFPRRNAPGSGRNRLERRLGLELRPGGRSGQARVQLREGGRLHLRMRDPCRSRPMARTRRVRRAFRARLLRGQRSCLSRQGGGAEGLLLSVLGDRASRRGEPGHGRDLGDQGLSGREYKEAL